MTKKLQTLKSIIKSIWKTKEYLQDPEVSKWSKFLLIFPLLYIISPIDLISDYLVLGFGWLDDTVIALAVWRYVYANLVDYRKDESNFEEKTEEEEEADYTLGDDEYNVD